MNYRNDQLIVALFFSSCTLEIQICSRIEFLQFLHVQDTTESVSKLV